MWRYKIWFKNNSKICCNNTHSPEPYYFPIPLKDSCLSLGIGATSVWERERLGGRGVEYVPAPGQWYAKSDEHLWPYPWHHHKHINIPPVKPGSKNVQPVHEKELLMWLEIICYTSQTAILLVSYHYLLGPSSYVEHTPFVDPPVKMQQSALRAHLVPQNCLAHPHK